MPPTMAIRATRSALGAREVWAAAEEARGLEEALVRAAALETTAPAGLPGRAAAVFATSCA
jgi:hypothetical protein